ncbi:MAG: SDR family oxidoreductase [Gammaproteobacteria bacterium]|nr:SDR family oxidoreductase [Gammaproteobacteria bacterium]
MIRRIAGRFLFLMMAANLAGTVLAQQEGAGGGTASTGAATAPTVLITGSNRGIGLEFARQYAALGWRVIATCRRPGKADKLKAIAAANPNVVIEKLDITDHAQVDALAERYSYLAIDLLLNNAALLSDRPKQAFGALDYDLFREIVEVNTIGTLKVTEAFTPHVVASNTKKIVTLGSAAGSITMINPPPDFYAYRASKAALHLLMKNVALDLADKGVLVGLINPGLVDTRGFADIGPDDPVPEDYKVVVEMIRSGALKLSTPEESVGLMIPLIDDLTPEQSGVFLNATGQQLPW